AFAFAFPNSPSTSHLTTLSLHDALPISLAAGDLIDHAKLQRQLKTPVCLDESIDSYEAASGAIELGSCRIINVKVGRVGGLTQSDRKSTRLNSSHVSISYAVFCLKKKKR